MVRGPLAAGSVLVCIPTYNERQSLPKVVEATLAADSRLALLIVDDGSPDGTGALADGIAEDEPRVQVLHRTQKSGLAAAYLDAFEHALRAGWQVVVQMDADLSHDPAEIPALVAALEAGAGLAIGSRYCVGGSTDGWSWRRRQLSRWGGAYARAVVGLPVSDPTSGFRAWRAEALSRLRRQEVRARGYAFQVEMACRAHRNGVGIAEVPIRFCERAEGESKMSVGIALEALALAWWLRRAVPPGGG